MPSLALACRLSAVSRASRRPFSPASLFSSGEQGVWYDPSDLSTLYQDAAGTIPVTAVGQPVGKILDKSGRGNHAFQATATSRPVLRQDASGRYYLSFDGVDDWMQTNRIDFTSTDKMTVMAGVRKLSDAATATLFETSSSIINNNGTLFFGSPTSTNSYQFNSKGSSESIAGSGKGVYVAPITNVVAGISDISGDSVILRVNGNQVAQSTADQGTGNYGNYPLYLGSRDGLYFRFNGWLYSLIIRGAQSTEQQIASAEAWVNTKTGAY